MRVSKSAIGSVTMILSLPTGLSYARNLTAGCKLAEADAAQAKFANVGTWTAADLTPVDFAGRKPRLPSCFNDEGSSSHYAVLRKGKPINCSSRLPSAA